VVLRAVLVAFLHLRVRVCVLSLSNYLVYSILFYASALFLTSVTHCRSSVPSTRYDCIVHIHVRDGDHSCDLTCFQFFNVQLRRLSVSVSQVRGASSTHRGVH
jgi:hypothetical protein